MHRIFSPLASISLVVLLGGCEPVVDPCAEFNPPPGHQPSTCPPKPKPTAETAKPARYCYRSLAQADCYAEPQPGRPGYQGSEN